MGGDVEAGVGERVGFARPRREVRGEVRGPSDAVGEVGAIENEELKEGRQVGTGHFAQHVALGKAHVREDGETQPEEVVEHAEVGVRAGVDRLLATAGLCSSGAATDGEGAISVGDAQRAHLDLLEQRQDGPTGDREEGRPGV